MQETWDEYIAFIKKYLPERLIFNVTKNRRTYFKLILAIIILEISFLLIWNYYFE